MKLLHTYTRKILYHWCQQFKFIYTVDFPLHFTLHLKHIFFMHLFKYLIFLVFFFTQFLFHFLFIHPPSLSYFIWLPWQWYIRHTQRRACYCFLCLSKYGELTQRNTLCCISWPSPVSVINHKTMKAINRSLPTLTPSQQQSLSSQN